MLFDLDGVITPTAEVHMHAWAEMFYDFLSRHDVAPYTEQDYFAHVDGRPRYDGVAALLASRDIELPWGDPSDDADAETVCGLGNRKNAMFGEVLARDGVKPYPGSVRLLDALDERGTRMAIVSSSANAPDVLRAAGLLDRFETVVDGAVAKENAAARQAGARHLRATPPTRSASPTGARSSSRTRSRACRRARPATSATSSASTAAPAPTRCATNGADVVVADLAELVDGARP